MKIGIYSFEYPSYVYIGGAGSYIKELAENLARLGHTVVVFVASFKVQPPEVVNGVTVWAIPIRKLRYVQYLQYKFQLKRNIQKASKVIGGFDLLHSNNPSIVGGFKVPSVMTVHHVVASLQDDISKRTLLGELNPILRLNQKRAVLGADGVITVSEQSKQDVISFYGVAEKKIVSILNGIPFDPYQFKASELVEVRAKFAPKNGDILIVTAPTRLNDPRKGLKYLLEALRQLSPHLNFKCVVLGHGDLEAFREYLDDDRLSGRIDFPGFVGLDVKGKLLAAADLYVLPSTLEGCPISLLEAMAAGRAVVASRVGGVPELIRSDKHGTMVPAKDPAALAKAILHLATDSDLRAQMGEYNRQFAREELSWTRAAERTIEVYEAAIASASVGAGDQRH